MIAWSMPAGACRVGPWPDRSSWSDQYDFTTGACFSDRQTMTRDELAMAMLSEFVIVVRDVEDGQAAYREFCKIDEFRALFEPDR